MTQKIELEVATSSLYGDSPPSLQTLQYQINEFLERGFSLYGNPYIKTTAYSGTACEHITCQMMIRYVEEEYVDRCAKWFR